MPAVPELLEVGGEKGQFPFLSAGYFLTMMIIALWHGLTWGFVAFGLLHGAALIALQTKRKYLDPQGWIKNSALRHVSSPPRPIAAFVTYSFFAATTTLWFHAVRNSSEIFARMLGWP